MITKFKIFENFNDEWIIPINDIIDFKIFDKIPANIYKYKIGDIVIGVWFDGSFETFLLKVGNVGTNSNIVLGVCDDSNNTCYELDMAWGLFDVDDYKKYDPDFEIKLNAKKYNL